MVWSAGPNDGFFGGDTVVLAMDVGWSVSCWVEIWSHDFHWF
jgi:hypothetical protein